MENQTTTNQPTVSCLEKKQAQQTKAGRAAITDAALLAECCNNNQQAWNELVKRYQPKMLAYLTVILNNEEDAKDVLQNAWERALKSLAGNAYKEENCFDAWFKSICYHQASEWQENKLRSVCGDEHISDRMDNSFNAEQLMMNRGTDSLLHKALRSLEEQERQVVILRACEERSFHEIAVMLHLSSNHARAIYSDAKKKMRLSVSER